MNTTRTIALVAMLAGVLACSDQAPGTDAAPAPPSNSADTGDAPETFIGRSVEKAIVEARQELRSKNISISDGIRVNVNGREFKRDDNLPKAEITPQGDLLIEGKQVVVDAAQRKLLLDYRNHIIAIADAGMAIGVRGADLAGKAISETIDGLISGDTGGIERKVEAEVSKIEADAMRLCAQLPPMLATQQQLATSLPVFKPYATMTEADIDDCGNDVVKHRGVAVTSG